MIYEEVANLLLRFEDAVIGFVLLVVIAQFLIGRIDPGREFVGGDRNIDEAERSVLSLKLFLNFVFGNAHPGSHESAQFVGGDLSAQTIFIVGHVATL